MGILDSLFGSKSKSTQSSTSSTDATSDTDTLVLSKLLESLRGNTSTSKGTEQSRVALAEFTKQVQDAIPKYGRPDAIRDSSASVKATVDRIINGSLGNILTAQTGAGAIGSTGTKNTVEDLVAKAAAAGAEVQQKAITDYAGLQIQGSDLLAKLVALAQEGDQKTTVEQDTTTDASETTDSTTIASEDTSATGTASGKQRDSILGTIAQFF